MRKLLLLLLLLTTANSFAATRTAVTNGNWTAAATWGGTVPQAADVAIIPVGITVTLSVNGSWSNPNTIRVSGKMIVSGNEPLFSTPCTLEVLAGGELNDQTIANQLLFMHPSFLKIQTGGKWTATGGSETLIYNSNYSAEYQFQNAVMNGPFQISIYASQVTYSTTVLPLKLISFSGKKSTVNNLLQWETASEINTDAFYIERSSDAIRYETLGKVTAKGSSGENHYSYTDRTALSGNNFYRLKMTDLDGTYTYSEIPVNIKRDAASQISIYPSPAKDFINVVTGLAGIISIYSSDGKLVRTQHLLAGNSVVDINKLNGGIYFIVQAGQKTSFVKAF